MATASHSTQEPMNQVIVYLFSVPPNLDQIMVSLELASSCRIKRNDNQTSGAILYLQTCCKLLKQLA